MKEQPERAGEDIPRGQNHERALYRDIHSYKLPSKALSYVSTQASTGKMGFRAFLLKMMVPDTFPTL